MERNLESGIKVRIWRGNRVGRVFRYLSTARSTLGFIVVVLRSKSAGEMREGVVNPGTVSSQVREIPSFEHLDFPSFYIFLLFFSSSFFFLDSFSFSIPPRYQCNCKKGREVWSLHNRCANTEMERLKHCLCKLPTGNYDIHGRLEYDYTVLYIYIYITYDLQC